MENDQIKIISIPAIDYISLIFLSMSKVAF